MRILLIGDNERAHYHPMERVLSGIRESLGNTWDMEVKTDYLNMSLDELQEYPVIISYLDAFMELDGFDDLLAEYVEKGGKILALHNGIITPEGNRLEKVYGGNFVTHPPYCSLNYYLDGALYCVMDEEPYQVRTTDDQNRVFLQFEYEGQKYDAGWFRNSGLGKVCYLAPGHDEKTFAKKAFRDLLKKCIVEISEKM